MIDWVLSIRGSAEGLAAFRTRYINGDEFHVGNLVSPLAPSDLAALHCGGSAMVRVEVDELDQRLGIRFTTQAFPPLLTMALRRVHGDLKIDGEFTESRGVFHGAIAECGEIVIEPGQWEDAVAVEAPA